MDELNISSGKIDSRYKDNERPPASRNRKLGLGPLNNDHINVCTSVYIVKWNGNGFLLFWFASVGSVLFFTVTKSKRGTGLVCRHEC